jgi:hypothetical protein
VLAQGLYSDLRRANTERAKKALPAISGDIVCWRQRRSKLISVIASGPIARLPPTHLLVCVPGCSPRSKAGSASNSPIGASLCAQALEDLSDRHFPNVKKIVLVQDNLNTHKLASLYEAFPPDKARRLVERFEGHYTPKHGSWLDMAESTHRSRVAMS